MKAYTVERVGKFVVIFVFICILLIGLFVFQDYGISTDEPKQRQHSLISYRSAMRMLFNREVFPDAGPPLSEYSRGKYYGVAMQLPLVFAEDMYAVATGTPMPTRTIYLMRHLYTFLVYWFALICFYLLLKRLFGSSWLALTGVLLVFLFGRFFAHACYNIKDMLFTSLCMITLCCAERVLSTDRKPVRCLLFAFSGALLVTSRVVGALLIVLLLLCLLWQDIAAAKRARAACGGYKQKSVWKRLLPYALICAAYPMWILVTPAAWSNPVGFSLGYVTRFSNYDVWKGMFPYFDTLVNINGTGDMRVPRTYFLAWILLTVPLLNQALTLGGVGCFFAGRIKRLREKTLAPDTETCMLLTMLVLVAGTLGYQFVRQPVVYDGWRHAFFLYPMMIVFAVYGLKCIWLWSQAHAKRGVWLAVCGLVALSLVGNAVSIAKNHPYEFMSYNLAGRSQGAYLMRDYWGLSRYDAVKWMLADAQGEVRVAGVDYAIYPESVFAPFASYTDNDEVLHATVNSYLFAYNLYLLTPEEQARVDICLWTDADYLLQSYARMPGVNSVTIPGYEEVYSISAYGIKLLSIHKRVG